MATIEFTYEYFKSLPEEVKLELLSLCLMLLGTDGAVIKIDNTIIKNRDDFFDWRVKTGIVI
jgi:hypothetical protein